MKAVRVNLFGGSSTKPRPDLEPRILEDHRSFFSFFGHNDKAKFGII